MRFWVTLEKSLTIDNSVAKRKDVAKQLIQWPPKSLFLIKVGRGPEY